jgi:hypothetical protein
MAIQKYKQISKESFKGKFGKMAATARPMILELTCWA